MHKDPKSVIDQAKRLTAVGDYMAIHFDAWPRPSAIRGAERQSRVTFAKAGEVRVKWSLVRASLNAVEAAVMLPGRQPFLHALGRLHGD